MKFLQIVLFTLVASLATSVLAQDKGNSNMEILRQKVKADKKLVVAANMDLTDAEAKKFWPIYEAYQKDLQQINERIGKAILSYAAVYQADSMTDAKAKELTEEMIGIEEAEAKMRRTYLPKLSAALPARKVARYMQIENKIRAAIRYELAGEIPLAP